MTLYALCIHSVYTYAQCARPSAYTVRATKRVHRVRSRVQSVYVCRARIIQRVRGRITAVVYISAFFTFPPLYIKKENKKSADIYYSQHAPISPAGALIVEGVCYASASVTAQVGCTDSVSFDTQHRHDSASMIDRAKRHALTL